MGGSRHCSAWLRVSTFLISLLSSLLHFLDITAEQLCSTGEEGMSLHIYISHNGDHLHADPVSFASYVPSIP